MLSEEAASHNGDRASKRRKVIGSTPQLQPAFGSSAAIHTTRRKTSGTPPPVGRQQTITNDSESSESEVEWEDVGFDDTSSPIETVHHEPSERLSITINTRDTPKKRSPTKRRPISAAEKAMRLTVHKMHITYLLYHGFYRNNWCNDRKSQVLITMCIVNKPNLTNPSVNTERPRPATAYQMAEPRPQLYAVSKKSVFHRST
jgi:xeroderma pigmentosum group C-complementing protein